MANLIIRKKSGGIFEHYDSQLFILSNFYVKVDVPYFQIQEIGGSQRKQYLVAQITVFDDTTGGGAETFTSFTQLMQRLKFLGYPAFSQTSGGGSGGGMPDGFQQLGTLTKLVDVLTVGFNYQWFISNNSYANTVEFSFNIPLESNNFNRKDIIVANTTNGFELISGFSSFGSNTAVQPITPIGKILLAVVDVFGNDINFDEIITNSFKTNKFYTTTLADLGVANFNLLTSNIVRSWINDLNAPNQDNEIYYYLVTDNRDIRRVYVLKNRLKNQLVTDEMVELVVDESKLDDYLLNGGYIGTAQDIEDSITLQQATAGANKNLVDGIFQAGTGVGTNQSGINVNQFGEFSGENNTGSNQNALGADSGGNNTGQGQNAIGNGAGFGNIGNSQNAFGASAGVNNIGQGQNAFGASAGVNNMFNDVNLFGQQTQADENGQTVFRSAGGFMVRLSTLLLTATRKYIFPNKSGTIALLDDIPVAGQLVKVTENNQTGYRLKDANPANYGNIGQDAVDLSISTSASNTRGATGNFSNAEGQDTIASGFASHSEGSFTVASGGRAHTEGFNTVASGAASHSQGSDTFARSLAEHSGGINGTDYTPQSAGGFSLIDRLVNYGNGVGTSNRSDAYTLFKNGMQKFFTAALSTITNATKGSVMLDENARLNIHDGTAFNAVAFSSEVNAKISGSGTINRLAKFTASGAVGNSLITDNGVGVSIGSTTISTIFQASENNGGFFFSGNDINYNRFKSFANLPAIGKDLLFSAQNSGTTPDLYIKNNGNVGINTTTPTERLDVVGNGKFSGTVSCGQFTTATEPAYVKGAQFFNTTLNKMRIGGATAYETVTSN